MNASPLLLAFGVALPATAPDSPARRFIAAHGDDWFNHKADDIREAYPFGWSDKANNDRIARELGPADPAANMTITRHHYVFAGDWYAVAWVYEAIHVETGRRQSESTLAFGRVRDGRLAEWREYFDDSVGARQLGQLPESLPAYAADEPPSPWPRAAGFQHPYRP